MDAPQRRICLFLIISNEFCERFCYYGFRSLLFIFMRQSYNFTTLKATWFMHLFNFMSYFFTLFGGILSDYVLGRYNTILYLTFVYLVGTLLVTYSSVHLNLSCFIFGLILISFGTGGIKPSVSTFGGDQFKKEEKNKLERFFNIFYFWINAGSILSMFYLPLLAKKRCLGKDTCYPLSFLLPSGLLVLSLVLFYSGSKLYIRLKPDKITLIRILRDVFPKIELFKDKNIEKSFYTEENVKERSGDEIYNECNRKSQNSNIPVMNENEKLDKEENRDIEPQMMSGSEVNPNLKEEEYGDLKIQKSKTPGLNEVNKQELNNSILKSKVLRLNENPEEAEEFMKLEIQNYKTQISNENFKDEIYNELNFNNENKNKEEITHFSLNDLEKPPKNKEIKALNNETQLQDNQEIFKQNSKSEFYISFLHQKYGDKFARDIKKILNLLKLFALLPIFWMLYDQQTSSWVEQASKLSPDIKIFSYSYHLPPSQMQALNPILILIFIPLFTYVIYPLIYRYFKVTSIHRMSLGMFFASFSFILSAFISFYLSHSASGFYVNNITSTNNINTSIKGNLIINSNHYSRNDAQHDFKSSASFKTDALKPPSILWQIPQYILITMGEILLSTTVLHFGYLHSPPSMRSLVLSMYLLTVALGNLYVMVFTTLEVVIFIRSKYAEGIISMFYACIGLIGSYLLFKCKNSLENKNGEKEED